MKKLILTLTFFMSVSVSAFAEKAAETTQTVPVNNLIAMVSAVVVLLGVVAVSIGNGIMYNKKTLRKTMQQYKTAYNSRGRSTSRVNNRGNIYNNHDESMRLHQQMNDEFNRQVNQQMIDEMNRHAMEESMKAITPFDHGGYVQGPGFNPSDTAAQQMNDMNNMNMGMF